MTTDEASAGTGKVTVLLLGEGRHGTGHAVIVPVPVPSSSDPATRVRAASRSREASSRDGGVREPRDREPFTSERDRASRTAGQSDTDAVWERG